MDQPVSESVPPSFRGRILLAALWLIGWTVAAYGLGSKAYYSLLASRNVQRWYDGESGQIVFDQTFVGFVAVRYSINELLIAVGLLMVAVLGAQLIRAGDVRYLGTRQRKLLAIASALVLVGFLVLILPAVMHALGFA